MVNGKDSGTIFEVLEAFLRLDYVAACTSCIDGVPRREFRQGYSADATSHEAHQDLRTAIGSNKSVGHGNPFSHYFAHNGKVTADDLRNWAVNLAKDYKDLEQFSFFKSEDDFVEELEEVKAKKQDCIKMMVPMLSRLLRCNIVLYLPDEEKPILFLPYPKVKGKAAPQFGDYFRHYVTLSLGSDMKFQLIISKDYQPYLMHKFESKIEEKTGNAVEKAKKKKAKKKKAKKKKAAESDGEEEEEEEDGVAEFKIREINITLTKTQQRQMKSSTRQFKQFKMGRAKDSDQLTELEALRDKAKKFLDDFFSKDKDAVYDDEDIVLALWENGVCFVCVRLFYS